MEAQKSPPVTPTSTPESSPGKEAATNIIRHSVLTESLFEKVGGNDKKHVIEKHVYREESKSNIFKFKKPELKDKVEAQKSPPVTPTSTPERSPGKEAATNIMRDSVLTEPLFEKVGGSEKKHELEKHLYREESKSNILTFTPESSLESE